MKILQYGKIKPKTAQCSECGCLLEYLRKDTEVDYIPNGYDNKIVRYVECPICECKIYVPRWSN